MTLPLLAAVLIVTVETAQYPEGPWSFGMSFCRVVDCETFVRVETGSSMISVSVSTNAQGPWTFKAGSDRPPDPRWTFFRITHQLQ